MVPFEVCGRLGRGEGERERGREGGEGGEGI